MSSSGIAQFIPLILIFVIFYFFLIRPQQKRIKDHKTMVAGLKRGDEVVTSGGVIGKIEKVLENDDESKKSTKYIMNALYRENGQRNFISEGIKEASDEDLILVSDVDEIPNLSNIDLGSVTEKIILFKQDMFYYKFNLKLPNTEWTGTKGCKKKNFVSAQWLRDIKDRKYSFFRLDTFFSEKKYISVKIINNGGWHFSNIKTAEEIEYKPLLEVLYFVSIISHLIYMIILLLLRLLRKRRCFWCLLIYQSKAL